MHSEVVANLTKNLDDGLRLIHVAHKMEVIILHEYYNLEQESDQNYLLTREKERDKNGFSRLSPVFSVLCQYLDELFFS